MEQVLEQKEEEIKLPPSIDSNIQRIKKNNVSTLIFFVTNRCNFKCNHCFYWQSLNINDVLSTENIKKIIDSIGC